MGAKKLTERNLDIMVTHWSDLKENDNVEKKTRACFAEIARREGWSRLILTEGKKLSDLRVYGSAVQRSGPIWRNTFGETLKIELVRSDKNERKASDEKPKSATDAKRWSAI